MPSTFETIGVITSRDLIGDALIKLPFARALRNAFPKARICWITSQGPTAFNSPLREATKNLIDEFYEQPLWLPTTARPKTSIPAPRFDLLIDTRNRWREAIYARELPHGLFLTSALHYLLSEKRPFLFRRIPTHPADRLLQLVELAAGSMPACTGALPVPPELMEKARKILPDGPVYIGLAPGCGAPVRAWPRFKFEKVAQTQAEKTRVPVFILGPQELNWYDELAAMVPTAKFPLQEYDVWGTPRLGIDHTLAVAMRLALAVGNDSGAGHILAAADCPMISLFGPTSPAKGAPRTSRMIAVRAQQYGSEHMRDIPWETVNGAIEKMLALNADAKGGTP